MTTRKRRMILAILTALCWIGFLWPAYRKVTEPKKEDTTVIRTTFGLGLPFSPWIRYQKIDTFRDPTPPPPSGTKGTTYYGPSFQMSSGVEFLSWSWLFPITVMALASLSKRGWKTGDGKYV